VLVRPRGATGFDAEGGVAHSLIGRAAYTLDRVRTITVEGAARQNGQGLYIRGEFSELYGQHWRLTFAAAAIHGQSDDFFGQYQRNSHGSATLRLSF
jgi:hypothetical protein